MLILDTRKREILRQAWRLLVDVVRGARVARGFKVSIPLADLCFDDCANPLNLSGGKVVLDADFFGGTA
jgi:hypothetical protein